MNRDFQQVKGLFIPLLIICLAAAGACFFTLIPGKHSYSYFVFLRLVVTVAACFGIWLSFRITKFPLYFVFGLLATIFNPIVPFRFHVEVWHVIDLAAGITLLVMMITLGFLIFRKRDRESV